MFWILEVDIIPQCMRFRWDWACQRAEHQLQLQHKL